MASNWKIYTKLFFILLISTPSLIGDKFFRVIVNAAEATAALTIAYILLKKHLSTLEQKFKKDKEQQTSNIETLLETMKRPITEKTQLINPCNRY